MWLISDIKYFDCGIFIVSGLKSVECGIVRTVQMCFSCVHVLNQLCNVIYKCLKLDSIFMATGESAFALHLKMT